MKYIVTPLLLLASFALAQSKAPTVVPATVTPAVTAPAPAPVAAPPTPVQVPGNGQQQLDPALQALLAQRELLYNSLRDITQFQMYIQIEQQLNQYQQSHIAAAAKTPVKK